ncbi:MAG: hypothetical protein D6696_12380, partial [Acidobacteria bacterium]
MIDFSTALLAFSALLLGGGGAWLLARRRLAGAIAKAESVWRRKAEDLDARARRLEVKLAVAYGRVESLEDQVGDQQRNYREGMAPLAAAGERADKLAGELLASRAELAAVSAGREALADELAASRKHARMLAEALDISRASQTRLKNELAAAGQQHDAALTVCQEQLDATQRAVRASEAQVAQLTEERERLFARLRQLDPSAAAPGAPPTA